MRAAEPSLTAKRTAVARGEHRLLDAAPWVLDDPFALILVGPQWRQIYESRAALHKERVRRDARAWLVARSRYAEDRLAARPFTQYVILGAGFDSFAWRRPDLLHPLRVFRSTTPPPSHGGATGSRRSHYPSATDMFSLPLTSTASRYRTASTPPGSTGRSRHCSRGSASPSIWNFWRSRRRSATSRSPHRGPRSF